MGNYRFKLSDMVPNAWFYMLKDMRKVIKGKSKVHHQRNNQKPFQIKHKEAVIPSRSSYFFSSREEAERPHVSPLHKSRASDTLFSQQSPTNSNKRCRKKASNCSHLVWEEQPITLIDAIYTSSYSELSKLQLQLPPIMTKPAKKEAEDTKGEEKRQSKSTTRRSPTGIHRLRTRANSPRVAATKKVQVGRKSVSRHEKGISKSFAVVKSSTNPQKDFRESMMEMISENNIKSSKELEELLACYLLLNANEYHDVIIKVFEKIWLDLTDIISL